MKCCKCSSEMCEAMLCGGTMEKGICLIQKRTDKDDQRDYTLKC